MDPITEERDVITNYDNVFVIVKRCIMNSKALNEVIISQTRHQNIPSKF